MRHSIALAAAVLALAGCRSSAPAPTPAPAAAADPSESGVTCDANRVQDLVGKPHTRTLAEDARRRAGARTVRSLPAGAITTMEYHGDRLNLDAAGKVRSARCG